MADQTSGKPESSSDDFAKLASAPSSGIVREFIQFLKHNKKWWMAPIIIILLLLGLLIILASTGAAPFIYTLF
jgi:Family of unknown function (DUF5989)